MKVLGLTDSVSLCDCCGKKNLLIAVVMERDGEIVHYGRDCAGAALTGKKNAKTASRAHDLAKAAQYARNGFAQKRLSPEDVAFRIRASSWATADTYATGVRIWNDAGMTEVEQTV